MKLKIGECDLSGGLVRSLTGSTLKIGGNIYVKLTVFNFISGDSIDLPASATVEKRSVSFFNKKGVRFPMPAACDPEFKKTAGGSLFNFEFSMDPSVSELKVTLEVSI